MEPLRRVTDAHAHVWAKPDANYEWQPELQFRPESVAPIEQLIEDMTEAGVADAVLVQPSVYAFDHRYLQDAIALAPHRMKGVMLVDPLGPGFDSTLPRTLRQSGITGLRMIPLRVERDWFGAAAEKLWRAASELSLVMTFLVKPSHIESIGVWARKFPCVPVVIDHLGRPDLAETDGEAAIHELLQISRFHNVHVKVSGLSSMSRLPPPHEDLWDWIHAVTEAFGVERIMWGSDYPWVLEKETIATALKAAASALSSLSCHDADQVFGGTARRLFRFR
jgi:L-fuconolactonase